MNKIISAFLFCIIFLLSGCKESGVLPEPDPDPIYEGPVRQVTLVYAVNGNNLSGNLELNARQMIEGLKTFPKGKYVILLFKTYIKELEDGSKKEVAGLFKAESGADTEFILQKEYSRDVLSTDPKRINEVITDALQEPGETYNLFLWGHGMAWAPNFSDHTRSGGIISESVADIPELTSFGGDNYNRDWCDIDELKDAIPDNKFDIIWFDCCYMSNIETIYELRSKCKKFVAYPTEIASDGLPYHNVLPYVLNDQQDLAGGCEALFEYYNSQKNPIPVTATVLDMTKIEAVAKSCGKIFNSGKNRPVSNGLQNYSRSSGNPFYDFGQFVREYAQANDAENLLSEFNKAMKEFVVFTIASDLGFDRRPIVPEIYSGISTHLFQNGTTEKDKYYMELDWYKSTYAVE